MSNNLEDIYGSSSQWLKAVDLKGSKPVVTIENAEVKENEYDGKVKKQIVLTFTGKEKALGLNITNARRVAELIGTTDYHNWIGWQIRLFVDKTEMDGKSYDCIRVFPDLPDQPNKPVVEDDDEDSIPF